MAHKITLTNESSVDPHVILLPRTLSSSSTSIGDFEALKTGNSCSFEMIFFLKMQNPHCTIICFDYDGYYMKDGAEIKWISGDGEGEDEIHTIVLRKSMEEITYSGLVERIYRKIKEDESKVQVKISYFPMFINEEVQLSEEDDETDGYVGLSDREAIEAGDEDGTENDETDVYVSISDKETTKAGDEDGNGDLFTFHEDGVNQRRDDEAGDEDGTENDATGNEGTGGVLTFHGEIEMGASGTGGVLTFHGDIEMHENFMERDEHVFEDIEVRPRVVYQPRDDGVSVIACFQYSEAWFAQAAEYWKQAITLTPGNYIEAQNWLTITRRFE
uniref:Uncharacterized protein n=1 Tax=Brassica oleracea var. oleracea TaxID=109376 RepID=A0A0D3BZU3_BRAOL